MALFLFTAFAVAISISIDFSSSAQKLDIDFAKGKVELAPEAGTISGRVYQDYNGNGVYDTSGGTAAAPAAIDTGIANVSISAYNAAGALSGTATTAADGTYSVSTTGSTGPYRVEFTSIPAGFSPSARSTDSVLGGTSSNSGSTVQFLNDGGTTNVNLAINRPSEFCSDNPDVCSQKYTTLGQNGVDALYTIPYRAGSTSTVVTGGNLTPWESPAKVTLAEMDAVGTTFGLAYSRTTRRIFTASFMKKHAAFGPGGTGAIYVVNRGTGVVSQWANVNTIFGANTAGANPHNTADYNFDNGQTTWNAVGKIAFGGLAINDAETLLYTINLANNTLYEIPSNTTPTSGNIRTSAFPTTMPSCTTSTDVRPFAVTFHEGLIYVGAICSADSTNSPANLRAYVYTVNPTTLAFSATPVLQFPLNYTRLEVDPGISANFLDWTTNYNTISAGHHIRPQPWLTDIDFDRGNMILSFRDRNGDQTGYNQASDPNNPTDFGRKGITAGEVLRACGSVALGWTLESNGICGGVTSGGTGNGQGPGGGEYYYQDNYHPNGTPHDEVGLGAAHQIPGFADHIASIFDPIYNTDAQNVYDSGGHRWFSNVGATAGQHRRAYMSYNGSDFGKANGMGNVIALCEAAPIEIGNRVWRDGNANGVQDPGELPIAGITVRLYQGSTLVGTAVTDANGEYYFVFSSTGDGNTGDNIGQVNGGILYNTAYQVRFDNPTNFAGGGPLNGLLLTRVDNTSQNGDDDSSDSDATTVANPPGSPAGNFPVISLTTGGPGANNHTFDVGFAAPPTAANVSVEGRVILSAGNGVRNALVILTEADGTQRTAVTGSFGYYRFDDIEAGQTVVVSIRSRRFTFNPSSRVVSLTDNVADLDFIAQE